MSLTVTFTIRSSYLRQQELSHSSYFSTPFLDKYSKNDCNTRGASPTLILSNEGPPTEEGVDPCVVRKFDELCTNQVVRDQQRFDQFLPSVFANVRPSQCHTTTKGLLPILFWQFRSCSEGGWVLPLKFDTYLTIPEEVLCLVYQVGKLVLQAGQLRLWVSVIAPVYQLIRHHLLPQLYEWRDRFW